MLKSFSANCGVTASRRWQEVETRRVSKSVWGPSPSSVSQFKLLSAGNGAASKQCHPDSLWVVPASPPLMAVSVGNGRTFLSSYVTLPACRHTHKRLLIHTHSVTFSAEQPHIKIRDQFLKNNVEQTHRLKAGTIHHFSFPLTEDPDAGLYGTELTFLRMYAACSDTDGMAGC